MKYSQRRTLAKAMAMPEQARIVHKSLGLLYCLFIDGGKAYFEVLSSEGEHLEHWEAKTLDENQSIACFVDFCRFHPAGKWDQLSLASGSSAFIVRLPLPGPTTGEK